MSRSALEEKMGGGGGGKLGIMKERYHKTLQHHAIPCGLALTDIIP